MAEVCMILGCAEDTVAQWRRKTDAAEPVGEFSVDVAHLCLAHQADWLLSPEHHRVDPLESEIEEAIELGRFVERLSARAGKPEEPPKPKFTATCDYCGIKLPQPKFGITAQKPSYLEESEIAKHKPNCTWASYWRKRA